MIISIILFVGGLGLVIYFAEKLVKGVVGTSLGFGISAFLLSTIFIGFDPENLAVGAIGSLEGVWGIALGSIIGAAMVAIALAWGLSILFAPMRFDQVPKQILMVPILAVLLWGMLGFDGKLSRTDGMVLLFGFVLSVVYLLRLSRRGLDIKPAQETTQTLEKREKSKWASFGLLVLSSIAIVLGSEMVVRGSEDIIAHLGLSDTVFGMSILAFLISIEEIAKELPAARKGRPEISLGNVVGTILALFLFNAGVIALVNPVLVSSQVLRFYLPWCLGTVILLALFMSTKKLPRWSGGLFVLLYLIFVIWGYI